MRYYTPTIFSLLSPAAVLFYLLACIMTATAAEHAAELLPNALTDIFGGKSELAALSYNFLRGICCFQLATVAAVVISAPVVNIVFAAKKKFKPKTAAIINLIFKLLTIPMYLMLVFAPIIALIGSVWGIGIALAILVFTVIATLASAFFSIPAVVSSARYRKIGKGAAFIMGFFSFLPAIDIIMAIVITALASKKSTQIQ